MKQKLFLVIFIAMAVFAISSCDSLWKHETEKPVTISFTIPEQLMRSVTEESARMQQNYSLQSMTGRSVNSNLYTGITAKVSLHVAESGAIFAEQTLTLGDSLDDTITFDNLYVVGETVYAQVELSQVGYITRSQRSNTIVVEKGLNRLEFEFDDAELAIYTLTFYTNGGSDVESQRIVHGKTASEPETPTHSDNIFAGWYKDSAFNTPWNFDNDIVTSDMTLYAKWIVPLEAVHLNGSTGDDTKSGENISSAVKSFEVALSYLNDSSTSCIWVHGTVTINSGDTWAESLKHRINPVVVKRGGGDTSETTDDDFTGVIMDIDIGVGNELTLTNITIDGMKSTVTTEPLIYIPSGKLILGENAILQNNINNTGDSDISGSGGGAFVGGDGHLHIDGGSIIHNEAQTYGGGVAVWGIFTMDSGSITDNISRFYGGGVFINQKTVHVLTGGSITGNTANGKGSGLYLQSDALSISDSIIINNNTNSNLQFGQWDSSFRPTVFLVGALSDTADINITLDDAAVVGETIITAGNVPDNSGTYTIQGTDVDNFSISNNHSSFVLERDASFVPNVIKLKL